MQYLILIVVAAPFICFGYFIMGKLDRFIDNAYIKLEDDKAFPIAIVLGETELANQVSELLLKNNIRIWHINEPFLINQEQNFLYLFALSDNDSDNIVLSKIAFKLYGIQKMISLCNDRRNESMFIKEKILYLSGNEITAQSLYNAVLQIKEESCE